MSGLNGQIAAKRLPLQGTKKKVIYQFDESSMESMSKIIAREALNKDDFVEVVVGSPSKQRVLLLPKL